MRVICQSRQRSDLPAASCARFVPGTAYELDVGTGYIVYAQYLAKGCLMYLIDPRDSQGLSRPNWYPAAWFSLVDNTIPASWVFTYEKENEEHGVPTIWGYPELVQSARHFDGLLDREEDELVIWLRRKAEIDGQQDSGQDNR